MTSLRLSLQNSTPTQRRWLMFAMLIMLHLALLVGVSDPLFHPLLIAHLGAFLMWQPMWRSESKLGFSGISFIGLALITLGFWLSWGLMIVWMGALFGLIGGSAFSSSTKWLRYFYLTALLYILGTLLLWVVPHAFAADALNEMSRGLMLYFMPLMLLAMLVMPTEMETRRNEHIVDFVYSMMLMLMVAVLVLGIFAIMSLTSMSFEKAVITQIFIIAGSMILVGWLWNPRFGFSGLQQIFSRYLLNMGAPFEGWLAQLALAEEQEPDVMSFLNRSIELLESLTWLSGASWHIPEGEGQAGMLTEHQITFRLRDLELRLFTARPAGTAMTLHINLLCQLIGHFYQNRRRKAAMRQLIRMQAVHETGARLTHDIKNLIQSILTLTAASQEPDEGGDFRQLMQTQLPLLAQRLQSTLEKLQSPQAEIHDEVASAQDWWDSLRARYGGAGLQFQADTLNAAVKIPVDMFSCVAENLIQNASRKRAKEHSLKITVRLYATPQEVCLDVCDNGEAVPERVTQHLFQDIVSFSDGLGVGLFQAARWAKRHQYQLKLSNNLNGEVRFQLHRIFSA